MDDPNRISAESHQLYSFEEEFRNSIATVDEKGKRIWVHPKRPSGNFHKRRVVVTITLFVLLFSGPFISIGGQPLLLLNVFERKFIVFGQAFWPQDFVLLAILLITFFVFIILFTVVYGRIWCGWMCPQTLFMEMVFRKIEYWIEGDANQQRKLNALPWTVSKILRKGSKQVIFIFIAALIAHLCMAYLIGPEKTFRIITDSPSEHLSGFAGLVAFTGIFYFVFAYFREQVCVAICPYGRLQSVLLVKDSIVVAYDWLRGEPRGKIRKEQIESAKTGDCIDCKLCVHVCPTGIDIRNGTQLECVNCTACIDACDEVMLKVNRPAGLIRYASHNSIQNGVQKLFTLRVAGYSFVLLALLGVLGFTLTTRSDVETTMLKVPGTLYQKNDDGTISNLYSVEFVNKTFEPLALNIRTEAPDQAVLFRPDAGEIVVPAEGMKKILCFIRFPQESLAEAKTVVTLGVYHNDRKVEELKVRFLGPVYKPK